MVFESAKKWYILIHFDMLKQAIRWKTNLIHFKYIKIIFGFIFNRIEKFIYII